MSRRRSAIRNWSEYLAVRAIAAFAQCFDVDQNLQTAKAVGSLYYRFSAARGRRAKYNIARAFPEWSAAEVEDIAERSAQYLFQLFMVDSLVMPRLVQRGSWPKYLRLRNLDDVLPRLLHTEPTIFVTAHCGNWELLGYLISLLDFPLSAVARPIDNPLLNDYLLGIRTSRGMEVITKWGAAPDLRRALERGGNIGMIGDQNAGDMGLFVPFFGRLASSYKSIGLLAMRHKVPIAVGHAMRLGDRFQYECRGVDFIHPDDWVDQPDPLFYITARYNRAMEQMIRHAPEQYLWVHRRWRSRPKHEREGRPFPKRLREKLEQLPWMTQAELEWIIEESKRDAVDYVQEQAAKSKRRKGRKTAKRQRNEATA